MPQLIEVSHVSRRGSSIRITIPKKDPGEVRGKGIRYFGVL